MRLAKKLLLIAVCGLLLSASAPERAELYLDGKLAAAFDDFQLIEKNIFLPLGESARSLGMSGFADPESRTAFFKAENILVVVDTWQRRVAVGSKVQDIKLAPIWAGKRVYVPQEVYTRVLGPAMGRNIGVVACSGESPCITPAGNREKLRNPVDVIMIDPGHGGRDHGAAGPDGIREKDVTLEISRKLQRRLLEEDGLAVHLTRNHDAYLDLAERSEKARRVEADVFISIHANGYKRISTEGFETFFASLTATDQAAADLAEWENRAGENESPGPDPVMTDIQAILGDMAQTEHLAESERLAEAVQRNLASVMNSDNRGVKQAPFRVLMNATMPAVLIEVGFITNPREARLITDKAAQDRIVEAIASAVISYRNEKNARLGLAEK